MSSSATTPTINSSPIEQDSNGQEYVETCDNWVRATLVMYEGHPHIRVQEHHEAGVGRLHRGPLIPLDQWFGFKESVDILVGPHLRESWVPLRKRTLSRALEYGILAVIACLPERFRSHHIGDWFSLVRGRVSEPFVHLDLEFAFRRLTDRGVLELVKDGHRYAANVDLRWFFGSGYFTARITPGGWAYWESIKT